MARPKKILDPEKIFKLARRQWTPEEIGSFFGVHADTIRRNYADVLEEAKHAGKAKLKDRLWTQAFKAKGSDKLFLHAVNRFVGPIPKVNLNGADLSDEELASIIQERLGVSYAKDASGTIPEVSGKEDAQTPNGDLTRSDVRTAKQIRRESSALPGRPNVPKRRKE